MRQLIMPLYRTSDPSPDNLPQQGNTLRKLRFFETLRQNLDQPLNTLDAIKRSLGTVRMVRRCIRIYEKLTRDASSSQSLPPFSLAMARNAAANALSRHGTTYKGRLRIAEALNLPERSQNLHEFVKQHNRMMHLLSMTKKRADLASMSTNMDVLVTAELQLRYLRWTLSASQINNSGDPNVATKLQLNMDLKKRSDTVIVSMKQEVLENLLEWDPLLPNLNEDVEYENIGADHDISTLGHSITQAQLSALQTELIKEYSTDDADCDHRIRCAICLDAYSTDDYPFQLTQCQHIIGRECMSEWLNSTHKLATTCPHCRTLLCARRARCPKGQTDEQRRRVDYLRGRIRKATDILADVMSFLGTIWGRHKQHEMRNYLSFWFNEELRRHGTDWYLQLRQDNGVGWMLLRTASAGN